MSTDSILTDATGHPDKRIRAAARRITAEVHRLETAMIHADRAAALRAQIAEAEKAFKRLPGHTRDKTTAAKEERNRIRAWAAENGHEIGARGRIPTTIIDAYQEAHRG